MYPEMDKIVEKTSTVIDRHSIYIKKHEYSSEKRTIKIHPTRNE
jgi:hypothetical protein